MEKRNQWMQRWEVWRVVGVFCLSGLLVGGILWLDSYASQRAQTQLLEEATAELERQSQQEVVAIVPDPEPEATVNELPQTGIENSPATYIGAMLIVGTSVSYLASRRARTRLS